MVARVLSHDDISIGGKPSYDFCLAYGGTKAKATLLYVQEYEGYVLTFSMVSNYSVNSRTIAVKLLLSLMDIVNEILEKEKWLVIKAVNNVTRVWGKHD